MISVKARLARELPGPGRIWIYIGLLVLTGSWVCKGEDRNTRTLIPVSPPPSGDGTAWAVFGSQAATRLHTELSIPGGVKKVRIVYHRMAAKPDEKVVLVTDGDSLERIRNGLRSGRCSVFTGMDSGAAPGGGAIATVNVELETVDFWFFVNVIGFHLSPAPSIGSTFTSARLAEAIDTALRDAGTGGLSANEKVYLSGPSTKSAGPPP